MRVWPFRGILACYTVRTEKVQAEACRYVSTLSGLEARLFLYIHIIDIDGGIHARNKISVLQFRQQEPRYARISYFKYGIWTCSSQLSTWGDLTIPVRFSLVSVGWFRDGYYYVDVLVRTVFLPRSTLECSDILLAAMSEYLA